jgi:hypothetical protein
MGGGGRMGVGALGVPRVGGIGEHSGGVHETPGLALLPPAAFPPAGTRCRVHYADHKIIVYKRKQLSAQRTLRLLSFDRRPIRKITWNGLLVTYLSRFL